MLVKLFISLFLVICGCESYHSQEENSSFNFNHPPLPDNIPVAIVYDGQEDNSEKPVSTTESAATTYHPIPNYRNLKALFDDDVEPTSAVQTKEGKPKKYSKIIRQKSETVNELQIPVAIVYDQEDETQKKLKANIETIENKKGAPRHRSRGNVKAHKNKSSFDSPEKNEDVTTTNTKTNIKLAEKKVPAVSRRGNIKSSSINDESSLSQRSETTSFPSTNRAGSSTNSKDDTEPDNVTLAPRKNVQRRRKLTTNATPTTRKYDNIEDIKVTTAAVTSTTDNIIRKERPQEDNSKVSAVIPAQEDSGNIRRFRTKDPVVPIVDSQNFVYSHTGDFHYSYESGDGTKAFEEGSMNPRESVVGGFSYKDKDGQDISLTYEAGVNGYQPVGAHLPTPPPIPPAIARALRYLATKTTPSYDDVTGSL